ncbi:MAG: HD domain-containing protein [Paludibacter sp.]|jgi:HD superfamily phosphohydrolase|nr:HD domain-containing protein [Paludibacter sp.]
MSKKKIINDPVFGFINIPDGYLYEIIQHPCFQRLSRIKQMGLSSFVYPGAQHTRLHHSLGAMHLMSEAITQLREQGHEITNAEADAAKAAILLHDIGHGPFSHTLENSLTGVGHEEISLLIMKQINRELNGALDLAISIFCNTYSKPFLHQLVSGQLDMDRIDYLSRDSFFSGVSEGIIGSQRIIKMLNLHNGSLVVDVKGIYSIEKFLVARRLMYWQVYLHKTSVAAEIMLLKILKRAKELAAQNEELFATTALKYFLYNNINSDDFFENSDALQKFILLDDSDIQAAIKEWMTHKDKTLSLLCKKFTDRQLFKVIVSETAPDPQFAESLKKQYAQKFGISEHEAEYFYQSHVVSTDTYNPKDESINILYKDGTIKDIAEASDMLNINVLTKKIEKYYFCYCRS